MTASPMPGVSVYGPPDAPPLLFIHGVWVSRRMWQPQVEAFSSDYRVVTADLPGHGELIDTSFDVESAEDWIADIITRTCGGRALLVGHSLGGYIAMGVACRFPDMATGLALADCSVDPVGIKTIPYLAAAQFVRVTNKNLLKSAYGWMMRARVRRSIAESILGGGVSMEVFPTVVGAIVGREYRKRLAAYRGPVVFINGQLDLLFRLEETAFVRSTNARLEIIRWAGHPSSLEQPEAFTSALRSFIATLPKNGSTPPACGAAVGTPT
jgi:pimeloyl-ACP methyl ester carboxylesterase